MFNLPGKVALVTGSAQGIGLAYVKELLRNDLKGVAMVDINATTAQVALNEIRQEFGQERAIFVKADVSDRTQLQEAFETTVKTFKQLDIVINNAGIVQELDWEKCVQVNLIGVITGSMLAIEKYFPKYKSESEAVILNTASIVGLHPFEAIPTYDATKFGIIGFTRALGGDSHYQINKVRVVVICPGVTDTSLSTVTKEQVSEPHRTCLVNSLNSLPSQMPEDLAKNAVDLLRNAPSGSVWTAVNKTCTKVEFPPYFEFSKNK